MPRFYFHQRSNGQLAEDRKGRRFEDADRACSDAIHLTHILLGKTFRSLDNTYFITEASDGEHSLCVVRGSVIIERR
jgi:hypothetical protein